LLIEFKKKFGKSLLGTGLSAGKSRSKKSIGVMPMPGAGDYLKISFLPDLLIAFMNFLEALRGELDKFFGQTF
jgi:hypothetical protein